MLHNQRVCTRCAQYYKGSLKRLQRLTQPKCLTMLKHCFVWGNQSYAILYFNCQPLVCGFNNWHLIHKLLKENSNLVCIVEPCDQIKSRLQCV